VTGKRYLVTGAAGFIGAKVAEFLAQDGHEVIGVDNFNDAYDVRIKRWRAQKISGLPGLELVAQDICDLAGMDGLLKSSAPVDGVINLAARAGVPASVKDPWIYLETNARGTINLLELCRIHGISKFVLASTSSLYGTRNPMPFREDADTNHPLSPYAASKKAAEVITYTYHFLYGLDVTVFRYFTVYGPAGRPDMSLFRFCQWIAEGRPLRLYGDGSYTRDFTFVDDIARGTILGLQPAGYEIVNLGNDKPHSMMETIRILEKLIGRQAEIEYLPAQSADMPATWADISKARQLLGWNPEVPLEEGLRRLVDWYLTEREWASQVLTE
jgi:nucleoside-diphosphate-sugar epimerase